MERVEEDRMLLEYIKKHPRMKFSEIAKLIEREHPDFKKDTQLTLTLARLAWKYEMPRM